MRWRRKPPPPAAEETGITLSDETRRARAAAADALVELAQVRSQTPQIARTARELADLNSHNGFGPLIRRALES